MPAKLAAGASALAGLSSSLALTMTQGTAIGTKGSKGLTEGYVANTPFVDPGAPHAVEFSRLQRELDGIREKQRQQEEDLRRRVSGERREKRSF